MDWMLSKRALPVGMGISFMDDFISTILQFGEYFEGQLSKVLSNIEMLVDFISEFDPPQQAESSKSVLSKQKYHIFKRGRLLLGKGKSHEGTITIIEKLNINYEHFWYNTERSTRTKICYAVIGLFAASMSEHLPINEEERDDKQYQSKDFLRSNNLSH